MLPKHDIWWLSIRKYAIDFLVMIFCDLCLCVKGNHGCFIMTTWRRLTGILLGYSPSIYAIMVSWTKLFVFLDVYVPWFYCIHMSILTILLLYGQLVFSYVVHLDNFCVFISSFMLFFLGQFLFMPP